METDHRSDIQHWGRVVVPIRDKLKCCHGSLYRTTSNYSLVDFPMIERVGYTIHDIFCDGSQNCSRDIFLSFKSSPGVGGVWPYVQKFRSAAI